MEGNRRTVLNVTIGVCIAAVMPAMAKAESGGREVVAVFDIQPQDVVGATAAQMAKFTGYLDSVVAASGFRTVPRSEIQARLAEQQKESYKTCYDEHCQIELGKAVAAQKAVSSTWARLGDACVLSVKLYDLKTDLAEFATKADALCNEAGLRAAIEDVGQTLKARNQEGYGAFTLDLNAGRDIKNPPTDKSGYLNVTAEAKGRPSEKIEVYINGELSGTTPFQKELAVGQYIVILRTAGDRFVHKRFDIKLGTDGVRIPKFGAEQLLPVFGTLVIDGSPSQATALINGEPRALNGTFREERRVGTYKIVVEAPGYLPMSAQLAKVPPGEDVHVSYGLVRNAGSISITGSPAGAQVVVDHASVGTVPMTLREVEVGDHVVEVQAPGHHPERKVASVKRGDVVTVDIGLREKRARLKVEAIAKVMGNETPVEADVMLDGAKIGSTPWKGEVLADVKHQLRLRLGNQEGPKREVELPEGREQREVIEVPDSWGGAVSTLRFKLVPGPWEIRSGPAALKPDEPNPVRPGRVPIDFLLDGKRVGRADAVISPEEDHVITITGRPRTPAELESSRSAWMWRKWLSLGASVVAGGVGAQRIAVAHQAQTSRDTALSALMIAGTSDMYDSLRATVIDEEHQRDAAQKMGLAFIGGASALAIWSAVEWLWTEPAAGTLEGVGVDAVLETP